MRSLAAKKMTLDRLGGFEMATKERRERKGRRDQEVPPRVVQMLAVSTVV